MRNIFIIMIAALGFGCSQGDTDYLFTIKTSEGDMKAILFEETPQHKSNFLKLVNDGTYDSLLFHRVIQGFMIQGGDPDSRGAQPGTQLGTGGPGYTIPAEFDPKLFHKKGALSAARQGDNINPQKESSGSQFYIVQGLVSTEDQLTTNINSLAQNVGQYLETTGDTVLRDQLFQLYRQGTQFYVDRLVELKPEIEAALNMSFDIDYPGDRLEAYTSVGGAPHLDDQYTVFGQVVEGLEVIDKIASRQTDRNDRPVEDVIMVIEVEEVPRAEITSKYGYEYPAVE